jgi:hypothetical protein
VSEGDLQAIAQRGYQGAASTDHDQQAQAVGLFLTDSLLEIWSDRIAVTASAVTSSLRVTV